MPDLVVENGNNPVGVAIGALGYIEISIGFRARGKIRYAMLSQDKALELARNLLEAIAEGRRREGESASGGSGEG